MSPDLVTEALEFVQHGGRNGAARNDHQRAVAKGGIFVDGDQLNARPPAFGKRCGIGIDPGRTSQQQTYSDADVDTSSQTASS